MGKTKTAFVSGIGEPEKEDKKKKKTSEKEKKVHISGLKGGQRIQAVETGPISEEKEEKKTEKKKKEPKKRGKKWLKAKKKVDANEEYPLKKAIKLAKETSYSKFEGTMELHLVVKKTGLNTTISLPFPFGKEKKIEIASDTTLTKLKENKIDFDILVATPEMMPKLVPFAKLLGPKGLMPNPKNGTLIKDPKKVKNFSANNITIKTERENPLIHTSYGKTKQKNEELIQNAQEILNAVNIKQVLKAYTKATMGPSVRIKL